MTNKTLAVLSSLIFAGGFAASARGDTSPQGGGANNVVLAQTTADGSSLVRSSTQVSKVGAPTVTSSNIATATATNCSGCHSTAVAVQVVFVTGSPQYYAPANAAAAANGGCTGCGSFAYAWQYVVQTSGPVLLDPAAQLQLQLLRGEIKDTASSVVPDSLADDLDLQARLDELTNELKSLIDTQTELAGVQATGAVFERTGNDATP
jgi:Fe-S cluster biogenesis protein NfuA